MYPWPASAANSSHKVSGTNSFLFLARSSEVYVDSLGHRQDWVLYWQMPFDKCCSFGSSSRVLCVPRLNISWAISLSTRFQWSPNHVARNNLLSTVSKDFHFDYRSRLTMSAKAKVDPVDDPMLSSRVPVMDDDSCFITHSRVSSIHRWKMHQQRLNQFL